MRRRVCTNQDMGARPIFPNGYLSDIAFMNAINDYPTNGKDMETNEGLINSLANSQVFHDFERAFSETTGMPLSLSPAVVWQLPLHGKRKENPFCNLVASKSKACSGCLRMQDELRNKATNGPATMTCAYGLCESAVPVRMGEQTVGYLQTGQVMRKKPTEAQFEAVARQLVENGLGKSLEKARKAFFETPVVTPKKFDSMTHLLLIFADHLSMKANQIALSRANVEPPAIIKARKFIEENYMEELCLSQVAAEVHTSMFYFCKLFKHATGMNFTLYVSRVRVEKAKNLLLNPSLRISEIAYEIGFQSLTHFNRVFRRIAGQSPTDYRRQLSSGS